jgi:hypothetical protein
VLEGVAADRGLGFGLNLVLVLGVALPRHLHRQLSHSPALALALLPRLAPPLPQNHTHTQEMPDARTGCRALTTAPGRGRRALLHTQQYLAMETQHKQRAPNHKATPKN